MAETANNDLKEKKCSTVNCGEGCKTLWDTKYHWFCTPDGCIVGY